MQTYGTENDEQLLLGRYRILQKCGTGGFGQVYVCRDPRLMRRVAIKTIDLAAGSVIQPTPRRGRKGAAAGLEMDSAEWEARQRAQATLRAALEEARTASLLSHPNIVQMIDFAYDDDYAYIIMEYVEGASLADILDATEDGLLTNDEAAAVVEAVGEALQFAHDNGVLHLDIKPDNIMIEPTGRVKIADFGMAALSSAAGFGSAAGGTIGYMPPEQLQGGRPDPRTDVFAFGAVMYEALTGRRPFAAADIKGSVEAIEAGVVDPCALNEMVSPQAADAILIAVEADPDDRHGSVEALTGELLAGLGRVKAGRKSLAALVSDITDDSRAELDVIDGKDTQGQWDGPDERWRDLGPLTQSVPGAARMFARVLGAVCTGLVSGLAVASMMEESVIAAGLITGILVALLALVAPLLSAALAMVTLVGALIVAGCWPLALAVGALGVLWWAMAVRPHPWSSAPTMASVLVGSVPWPWAPLLCGYYMPVVPALMSVVMGYAVRAGLAVISGSPDFGNFAWAGVLTAEPLQCQLGMRIMLREPGFWLGLLIWMAAAAVVSAMSHGRDGGIAGKTRCMAGMALGVAVLVAGSVLDAYLGSNGVWTGLALNTMSALAGASILGFLQVYLLGSPDVLDVDGSA